LLGWAMDCRQICGQTTNTSQSFLLGVVVDCTYICGQREHIYQSLLRGVIGCTLIFVGKQYTTPSYQCKALPFFDKLWAIVRMTKRIWPSQPTEHTT
jgi:hypothetical protein